MPVIPAWATCPSSSTEPDAITAAYCTESSKSRLVGLQLSTTPLKLNWFSLIGAVAADPVGSGLSTSAPEPTCTASEKLNTRFPDVTVAAAPRDGLYVQSVGA